MIQDPQNDTRTLAVGVISKFPTWLDTNPTRPQNALPRKLCGSASSPTIFTIIRPNYVKWIVDTIDKDEKTPKALRVPWK